MDAAFSTALEVVRQRVNAAFDAPNLYHGIAHAAEVEASVIAIFDALDAPVSGEDRWLLRIAAVLHDVGYAAYTPLWSQDRREHIRASLEFAERILPDLAPFAADPALVLRVSDFVAHHDDTNYTYPSVVRAGEVVPVELGHHAAALDAYAASLTDAGRERLYVLRAILSEADARAATGANGARRTFDYSTGRGLPVFAPGNPLNAWCWEESAVGNVRVAARRLRVDAISREGRALARQHYAASEAFIQSVCAEHGVAYVPEFSAEPLTPDPNADFRITRYFGWTTLEAMLRAVALNGDPALHPYASATIQPRLVRMDSLRPAAYYALHSKIENTRRLHDALESRYALSLFDLTGVLDFEQDGQSFRIAPPLVETYHEAAEGDTVSVLVDGMHRLLAARACGLDSMWVMEVSNLPAHMPLVPLPLRWDDVQIMDSVPPLHAKRKFRFPSLSAFPDVSAFSRVPITEDNYLYFFYRDLSPLGSPGIRPAFSEGE